MNLTETAINRLEPKDKRYDVYDSKLTGLCLRIETTGEKTWYLCYRHPLTKKRSMKKLGLQKHLPVAKARDVAQTFMATLIVTKEDPAEAAKNRRERLTIGQVVALYRPWIEQHRKSARQTAVMLNRFSELFHIVAEEITPADVTKWKQACSHLNPKTINRRVALLKGMFSWAVKEGHIRINPLKGRVEMIKEDDDGRIRFLTPDERERLLCALDERDSTEKDYFRCAVLLSLNTGIRKGTLLALKWDYIDFINKSLHLPAKIMKGGKTKSIPLNEIALGVLKEWRERSKPTRDDDYVFPGEKPGTHLGDTKKPWMNLMKKAGIDEMNWHDMRHDFASQLAMQGVDILTIQKLMTHENLKMTLVYAHLSPHHLERAVNELSNLYK